MTKLHQQLDLFADHRSRVSPSANAFTMDPEALNRWKQRIFAYQAKVRATPVPEQQSLFVSQKHYDSDRIDPFTLPLNSSQFYRLPDLPTSSAHQGCLYFVIDNTLPLLLYVGETKLSASKRWKGVHDCKDYILHYIALHRRYGLEVQVASAFWWDVPADKKVLLGLERDLILRWRSPFNKECWRWWGQPFARQEFSA